MCVCVCVCVCKQINGKIQCSLDLRVLDISVDQDKVFKTVKMNEFKVTVVSR